MSRFLLVVLISFIISGCSTKSEGQQTGDVRGDGLGDGVGEVVGTDLMAPADGVGPDGEEVRGDLAAGDLAGDVGDLGSGDLGVGDVVNGDGAGLDGKDGNGQVDAGDTGGSDLVDVAVDGVADGGDSMGQDAADVEGGEVLAPAADIEYMKSNWPLGQITASVEGAFRGTFESPSGTLGFLVLSGSHYEMGYQHGYLTGADMAGFWGDFVASFSADLADAAASIGMTQEQMIPMLQAIIQQVWNHMLPFMSPEFLDEVAGFADGAAAAGIVLDGWSISLAVKALLVLSNISDLNWSGTFEDALDKLSNGLSPALQEYYGSMELALLGAMLRAELQTCRKPMTFANSCSFFGAWGENTKDGHYIGSRNLDWGTDTGIRTLAGIVFYFPAGGIAHAAIGYLGFIGSLAGMNAKGVVLSEVGSESELERLKGEPWGFKFRRILEHADSLDKAMEMALGLEQVGPPRPTTIGYNFAIGFGDPENQGAGAAGAVLETNGLRAGVYRHGHDCTVDATLYEYAPDGTVMGITTNQQNSLLVNMESQAVEVNALGQPRLFKTDENGAFVMVNGAPVEDAQGQPFPVGLVMPCAFYRGDEALMHSNRMWQRASSGPQGGSGLLVTSGSYKNRYKFSYMALKAILEGVGYGSVVPDNNGEERKIGLDEGEWVAKGAAMGSNVMTIVYDATGLEIRLSFEKGTGPNWTNAVAVIDRANGSTCSSANRIQSSSGKRIQLQFGKSDPLPARANGSTYSSANRIQLQFGQTDPVREEKRSSPGAIFEGTAEGLQDGVWTNAAAGGKPWVEGEPRWTDCRKWCGCTAWESGNGRFPDSCKWEGTLCDATGKRWPRRDIWRGQWTTSQSWHC